MWKITERPLRGTETGHTLCLLLADSCRSIAMAPQSNNGQIRDTSASRVNLSERAAYIPRIIARAHWTFGATERRRPLIDLKASRCLYFSLYTYNIMDNGAYYIYIDPMMNWTKIA
jgi:hypothetical protein